jgi:hypothetical protein
MRILSLKEIYDMIDDVSCSCSTFYTVSFFFVVLDVAVAVVVEY